MNGGANSSSAPVLTALNIFNAIKPEKCIALVNALIFYSTSNNKKHKQCTNIDPWENSLHYQFLSVWTHYANILVLYNHQLS